MTVESTRTKAIYRGNGSATLFPVPFAHSRAEDLRLVLTGADGTETEISTGFRVEVNEAGDTSVVYPLSGPLLSAGQKLTIYRDTPQTQIVDLLYGGAFSPNVLEKDGFDRLEMQIQELQEEVDRAIIFPISHEEDVPTPQEFLDVMDDKITDAATEADRSKSEADRAQTIADEAETTLGTIVGDAQAEADRSTAQADRAESEADRAESEADRAMSEADRAQSQTDYIVVDTTDTALDLNSLFTASGRIYATGPQVTNMPPDVAAPVWVETFITADKRGALQRLVSDTTDTEYTRSAAMSGDPDAPVVTWGPWNSVAVPTIIKSVSTEVDPEGQPAGTYLVIVSETSEGDVASYVNLSEIIGGGYSAGNGGIDISADNKISLKLKTNEDGTSAAGALTLDDDGLGMGVVTAYATCSTAAATRDKLVTIPGFVPYAGALVGVRFNPANSAANARLSVNGVVANILARGANANLNVLMNTANLYVFQYDGESWNLVNIPSFVSVSVRKSGSGNAVGNVAAALDQATRALTITQSMVSISGACTCTCSCSCSDCISGCW